MKLDRAIPIGGWMEGKELERLAKLASVSERIVEIGSFLGRSTRALADNTKGFVVAIDDWQGPRDTDVFEDRKTLYEQFCRNMSDLIAKDKVRPLRIAYEDLPGITLNFVPDMVFIDGDHGYDSVMRDISWAMKLTEEAEQFIISGHDIYKPTVRLAVLKYFKNFAVDGELWIAPITRPKWGANKERFM